jgi:hypothetical protein
MNDIKIIYQPENNTKKNKIVNQDSVRQCKPKEKMKRIISEKPIWKFTKDEYENQLQFLENPTPLLIQQIKNKLSGYKCQDIEKNLYIYYKDNSIHSLNIKKDRGYYYEITDDMVDIDFDAPSEQVRQRLKEYHLEPVEMPCLIYSNNNFINDNVSNKYKMILEYEMMNHDYKTWDDIKNIVVMEERYKRD